MFEIHRSITLNLSLFFRSIYFPFPIHFRQFKEHSRVVNQLCECCVEEMLPLK